MPDALLNEYWILALSILFFILYFIGFRYQPPKTYIWEFIAPFMLLLWFIYENLFIDMWMARAISPVRIDFVLIIPVQLLISIIFVRKFIKLVRSGRY
ncbi:MAG: hypothetical protein JJT94_12410 [Bernardetiaceae bacterium]|nr:hypothetical protein [Bernardetiaceae bacterium]